MIPSFAPTDIVTAESTRSAPLKWVVIVDKTAAPGRMVNAVACISAATGAAVEGLIAHGGPDADGTQHPGLPWAGCSILTAGAEQLVNVRRKALEHDDILVVDMPVAAQTNRVYDEYLAELSTTRSADVAAVAISLIGPRASVDAIVKRFSLLA